MEETKKEEFVEVKTNENGEKVVESVKKGNPKAKVELRDGELDFRGLSAATMKQLTVRAETEKISALNNLVLCACEIEVILMKMAEKMGISREEISKLLQK